MNVPKEFFEIIKETKKFAKKELADNVLDMDLNPTPDRILHFWKKSAALDIPSLLIPEKFDGVGYGSACSALILDVLANQCPGFASIFAHHFAGCLPISMGAAPQQKKLWNYLADGAKKGSGIVGVVFSNEDDDNAPTLKKSGKNFILSGMAPLSANVVYADLLCVFVIDKDAGATCVPVKTKSKGLSLGKNAEIPGLKANPFFPIHFDDVKISPDSILGKPGQAGAVMEDAKNLLFAFTAAMAVGAARNAYDKALAYAKERYQFGDVIINHQEIRRMLGAMLMKLEVSSATYMQWFDEGKAPIANLKNAALTKTYCTDAAFEIALDAVQIHGGYGYMHEQGVEKIMRDAKVLQVLGGSNPRHMIDAMS